MVIHSGYSDLGQLFHQDRGRMSSHKEETVVDMEAPTAFPVYSLTEHQVAFILVLDR